jgi:hypothetical protein
MPQGQRLSLSATGSYLAVVLPLSLWVSMSSPSGFLPSSLMAETVPPVARWTPAPSWEIGTRPGFFHSATKDTRGPLVRS